MLSTLGLDLTMAGFGGDRVVAANPCRPLNVACRARGNELSSCLAAQTLTTTPL